MKDISELLRLSNQLSSKQNRMKKRTYYISVQGETVNTFFKVELDEKEFLVAKMIVDKCNQASTFAGMPTMTIKEQVEITTTN